MKPKLILLLLLALVSHVSFSQNDTAVARYELNRLDQQFGYRTKLIIKPTGDISSTRNQEIILSLEQLKKVSAVPDKQRRLYIVRFIIAHEFAHQVQFYRYRSHPTFLSDDLVSKTLLETQADLMAGFCFFILSPELMMYITSQPEFFVSVYTEVFESFYKLGIREYTLGTHASKRDRILAMRTGMSNGVTFMLDQQIKKNAHPSQVLQQLKPVEAQMRVLDIGKGEDMVDWAYRQAKKIVNFDRKVSNDIVLITPPSKGVVFNESHSDPYCYFDLEYKNIGTRPINVEMELATVSVKRSDPKSPTYFRKINVRHEQFTIRPGEVRPVKGRLMWLKTEGDLTDGSVLQDGFMPRFVYPGGYDEDGLISCTYNDENSQANPGKQIRYAQFSEEQEELLQLPIFLNNIITACETNPRDITTGIGRVHSRYRNVVSYNSSIQYDEGTTTRVLVNTEDKTGSVELFFPRYRDKATMMREYERIKSTLQNEFDELSLEEHNDTGDPYFWLNGEEYSIEVKTIHISGDDPIFSIQLFVGFD